MCQEYISAVESIMHSGLVPKLDFNGKNISCHQTKEIVSLDRLTLILVKVS